MVTVRRFWSLEGEVGRRSLSKRSQIGAFGAVRHMGRLDYFGIGPQTPRSTIDPRSGCAKRHSARADGSVRLRPCGWAAALRPTCPISAGARARRSVRSKRSSRRRRCPASPPSRRSADIVGSSSSCIPMRDQPDHRRHPTAIAAPTNWRSRPCAITNRARHNFHRWETEVQQRIPGLPARPASDAAWLPRVDQYRRRCALLHAVHARRQPAGSSRSVPTCSAPTARARHCGDFGVTGSAIAISS